MRAIGEREEMEEERRLCYVALTRAKTNLQLVCARQRMLFGRTNSNRVSRFVDEIPDEHISKNIPKGCSYSEKTNPWGAAQRAQIKPKTSFSAPAPKSSPALPDFALGDNVKHKAFGSGVIVKLTPMGGDYLVEINFETVGMKKLMLRVAAQMMTKE